MRKLKKKSFKKGLEWFKDGVLWVVYFTLLFCLEDESP